MEEKTQHSKSLQFVLAVCILGAGMLALSLLVANRNQNQNSSLTDNEMREPVEFMEPNEVVIPEQQPGNEVAVRGVVMEQPGFVIVRDDLFGQPGVIVGVSQLLQRGQTIDLSIPLSGAFDDDRLFYAIIYADDGDGRFYQQDDTPVVDEAGEVVMKTFRLKGVDSSSLDVSF